MSARKTQSRALCLAAAVLGGAAGLEAREIRTGPIDRAAFQALVDGASPGDTIVCAAGVYDFTAEPALHVTKPLRIVAEDPARPPLFLGRTDSNGKPVLVPPLANNGFTVEGLTENLRGLEFVGLHFTGFHRALVFVPHFPPGDPCNPSAPGELSKLRVESCRIENTHRGVTVFGGNVDHFDVKGNSISGDGLATSAGIMVVGGAGCAPPIDIGRSRNGTISGNHVEGARTGIFASGSESVSIRNNDVSGGTLGIALGDGKALELPDDGPVDPGYADDNTVRGALFGMDGFGPTSLRKASLSRNTIVGADVGIILEDAANNFQLAENDFGQGSGDVDIYLDGATVFTGPTHDNKVIVDEGTTVVDLGERNKVVGAGNAPAGTLALASSRRLSDEARQKLRELRDLRAAHGMGP